jgi:hypothetical protein
MKRNVALALLIFGAACSPSRGTSSNGRHDLADSQGPPVDPGPDFAGLDLTAPAYDLGCGSGACYTVYAHADHTLYSIDLGAKSLVVVGPFKAPMVTVGTKMEEDTITDLAVAPDGTIYVVSHSTLYTASATDGHVTKVGDLMACGQDNVALSFTPDNKLYVADYKGEFCQIDFTQSPPTVTPVAKLSGNLAVSGDLVAVADGTMYASAYLLSDAAGMGTQANNVLVKIDPATAAATMIGPTGFPKLFGVAFQQGQVFGFTHDGTGHVVTIDPMTGAGTLYNTFSDPSTKMPISFAGAGVNALVSPTIM